MKRSQLIWMVVVMAAAGCNFMKSTAIQRFDDNSLAGQSNGAPKTHGQPREFRGVPVALQVPTHVDVEIVETYFLYLEGNGRDRKLREVRFDDRQVPRNLDVKITPIMTKKLFTVDFVRPIAGSLDYSAEFTDAQYFHKIENTIEDKTIQDIAAAIKTVGPSLLGKKSNAVIGESVGQNVSTATRTVAYARFDIDAPDFENQLNGFLTTHVTGCHNCQGRIAPTSDEAPHGSENSDKSFSSPRLAPLRTAPAPGDGSQTRRAVLATPEYVVYSME